MTLPDEPISLDLGQVYTDARSDDQFELIYFDGNVYIVQERNGAHRFGRVDDFRKNVRAERYSPDYESDSFAKTDTGSSSGEEIQFEELEGIGETGANNLREAGIVTTDDVYTAADEDILNISWVGEKGLQSIRDAV
jgi:predicted flap endonuclease-1-like 5' DNA nuclease